MFLSVAAECFLGLTHLLSSTCSLSSFSGTKCTISYQRNINVFKEWFIFYFLIYIYFFQMEGLFALMYKFDPLFFFDAMGVIICYYDLQLLKLLVAFRSVLSFISTCCDNTVIRQWLWQQSEWTFIHSFSVVSVSLRKLFLCYPHKGFFIIS